MGLTIENERVLALAREAVRRTGGNQTSAIELALLADLDRDGDPDARLALIEAMQRASAVERAR